MTIAFTYLGGNDVSDTSSLFRANNLSHRVPIAGFYRDFFRVSKEGNDNGEAKEESRKTKEGCWRAPGAKETTIIPKLLPT